MLQKKADALIGKIFPTAGDAKDVSVKYLGMLQNDYRIDVSRMLMATSLCSDDINVQSTSFFNVLWGPFAMGGLGGLPFAGTTGMTAFAHHIPDEGTAFIFYGPHIGITLDGELGKMYRPRQNKPTSSCGALMLALNRFRNKDYAVQITPDDYQQKTLEALLLPHQEEILSAESPERKITELAFDKIDAQIHRYLCATKSEFAAKKIVLLGGIVINTDPGVDDYFETHNFEVLDVDDL